MNDYLVLDKVINNLSGKFGMEKYIDLSATFYIVQLQQILTVKVKPGSQNSRYLQWTVLSSNWGWL